MVEVRRRQPAAPRLSSAAQGRTRRVRAASPKHGGSGRAKARQSSRSWLHSRSGSGKPLTWEGEGLPPVAGSDVGRRVRVGRGWVSCATVAVSAGGAVRERRADSAVSGSVRPCVEAVLTWRTGRRPAPQEGGSAAIGVAQMLTQGAIVWRALEVGVESWYGSPDMSMIVKSYRYRLFVRGMRLALLFPVTALLMLLVRLGVAESVLAPLVMLFFVAMVLGIIVGWIGAVLLVRDTSRYAGAARGSVDTRKVGALIRQAARDICNLRRW